MTSELEALTLSIVFGVMLVLLSDGDWPQSKMSGVGIDFCGGCATDIPFHPVVL